MSKLNYEKLAFEITKLFIGSNEIDQSDYKKICKKTYSECFGEEIISLDKLKENEFVLNLFMDPPLLLKILHFSF